MNVIVVSSTVDGIQDKKVRVDELILHNGDRVVRPESRTIMVIV